MGDPEIPYFQAKEQQQTSLQFSMAQQGKDKELSLQEIQTVITQNRAKISQVENNKQQEINYYFQETQTREADMRRAVAGITQEKETALSDMKTQYEVRMNELRMMIGTANRFEGDNLEAELLRVAKVHFERENPGQVYDPERDR